MRILSSPQPGLKILEKPAHLKLMFHNLKSLSRARARVCMCMFVSVKCLFVCLCVCVCVCVCRVCMYVCHLPVAEVWLTGVALLGAVSHSFNLHIHMLPVTSISVLVIKSRLILCLQGISSL